MLKTKTTTWAAALALLVTVAAADERAPKTGTPKLTVGTKVGQRLPQFQAEFVDLSGEKPTKTAFDSHKNKKATAYVFMSRTCPYCKMYQDRLADMGKAYAAKGINFVMVYPTRKTPAAQKMAYHKSAGFTTLPLVNDKDASIAKVLSIKKTPEIVLTAESGEIVFRGGIDDSPFDASKVKKPIFKNACDAVAAGKKVKVTSAPLWG